MFLELFSNTSCNKVPKVFEIESLSPILLDIQMGHWKAFYNKSTCVHFFYFWCQTSLLKHFPNTSATMYKDVITLIVFASFIVMFVLKTTCPSN